MYSMPTRYNNVGRYNKVLQDRQVVDAHQVTRSFGMSEKCACKSLSRSTEIVNL